MSDITEDVADIAIVAAIGVGAYLLFRLFSSAPGQPNLLGSAGGFLGVGENPFYNFNNPQGSTSTFAENNPYSLPYEAPSGVNQNGNLTYPSTSGGNMLSTATSGVPAGGSTLENMLPFSIPGNSGSITGR